jgi:hypothetical protein
MMIEVRISTQTTQSRVVRSAVMMSPDSSLCQSSTLFCFCFFQEQCNCFEEIDNSETNSSNPIESCEAIDCQYSDITVASPSIDEVRSWTSEPPSVSPISDSEWERISRPIREREAEQERLAFEEIVKSAAAERCTNVQLEAAVELREIRKFFFRIDFNMKKELFFFLYFLIFILFFFLLLLLFYFFFLVSILGINPLLAICNVASAIINRDLYVYTYIH